MRKLLLIIALVYLLPTHLWAQGNEDLDVFKDEFFAPEPVYKAGDIMINTGVGIGLPVIWVTNYRVPLIISAEYGFDDKVSLGLFTVFNSGFEPVSTTTETYAAYKQRINGLRMSIHLTPWINERFDADLNTQRLDLYFGAMAGLTRESYLLNNERNINFNFFRSAFIGSRFMFNSIVGLYLELGGTPNGLLNGGLTLKL